MNISDEVATREWRVARIARGLIQWRMRATEAEQEAAEWKRRFDMLLSKCALVEEKADD